MNILIAILTLLFAVGVYALDVRTKDGVPEFQKYDYHGIPVWDEQGKTDIMDGVIVVSTHTPKDVDFILVSVPALVASEVSQIKSDRTANTRSDYLAEYKKRTSKDLKDEK